MRLQLEPRNAGVGSGSLLEGLTPAQAAAVMSDDSPLCLIAGAGSGKTRVLTRRIARRILDGSADPEHVLVVTFTRKAAGEVRWRLSKLGVAHGVQAGTFHAAAYSQLRTYWSDQRRRPPKLIDDPRRILRELLDRRRGKGRRPSDLPSSEVASGLAGEIHWARARLVSPSHYEEAARLAGRKSALGAAEVAELYEAFAREKHKRGVIDLDDLVDQCAVWLEEDSRAAAAQQWRIRHLFVDEFQDLNPSQWRLLRAWLGDRDDLFVVGDPLQAVYGWNGADPTLLERLGDLLPGTTVLRLGENLRSTSQIVATARAVLGHRDDETSPGRGDVQISSQRQGAVPQITAFDSDHAEAIAVARWLRCAHRPGRTWSQLAVLARTNARLEPVAEVLRRSGIPYRLSTPGAAEFDADTRGALRVLRSLPSDTPLRAAMAEMVVALQPAPDDSTATADRLPAELWHLADEHAAREPDASVESFLSWLAAETHGEGTIPKGGDRVELSTFHKAKGLEWPAVAVIGLEDGLVPIFYATTDEALAEEQRLLYVALTRSSEELWSSWARSRMRDTEERAWSCEPSPYVEAIRSALKSFEPESDLESRKTHLRDLRASLAATG